MNKDRKLKDCPFCGYPAVLFSVAGGGFPEIHGIGCSTKGCFASARAINGMPYPPFQAQWHAIDEWNERGKHGHFREILEEPVQ